MRINNNLLPYIFLLTCLISSTECYGQHNSPPRKTIGDWQRIVTPNGIQETFKAEIGGITQWVSVRGQDKNNPIILFVHGGPASPDSASMWTYQKPIEEFFTVVNYDQRGAGKTYLKNKPHQASDSLQINQYVQDAVELTELIRRLASEIVGSKKFFITHCEKRKNTTTPRHLKS